MAKDDAEVLELIKKQNALAKQTLKYNIDALHNCSEYLLEYETITGEEFMQILNYIN